MASAYLRRLLSSPGAVSKTLSRQSLLNISSNIRTNATGIMKLSYISWLLGAFNFAYAASPGRVLLLEQSSAPSNDSPDTVSPRIARLIFAQRLGLSGHYSLDGAEPAEIEKVDRYGGSRQHLLSGPTPKGSRAFILVDGIEDAAPFKPNSARNTIFDIVPAPHPEDTKELLDELADQACAESSSRNAEFGTMKAFSELFQHSDNSFKAHGDQVFMHISSLARLLAAYGDHSPVVREEAARVRDLIEEIQTSADFSTVTLVFMPPESHCNKRVGASKIYGGLQRRSILSQSKRSEFPMTEDDKDSRTPINNPAAHPLASSGSPIPSRFTSLNSCQRVTSNCTGHGECQVVAKEPSGDRTNEFYGCVCNKPAIRNNTDGSKKTTYFGGAACQKKNVVAPFWLLAGVTLFLVSIVTMGIGMLYSMGSEELPSVIGAGVSGPRAK